MLNLKNKHITNLIKEAHSFADVVVSIEVYF